MCMSSAAAAAASPQTSSQAGIQLLPYIQGYENTIAVNLNAVLASFENFALALGEDAVIFLAIVGVIIWFSRLNERLGKKFVEGGVVIAIFVSVVAPYITHAYC